MEKGGEAAKKARKATALTVGSAKRICKGRRLDDRGGATPRRLRA